MNFNTKAELFNHISSFKIKPHYQLARNDLRTLNSYENDEYIAYEVITSSQEMTCPGCGHLTSSVKDKRTTYPTVGLINEKPVLLKLTKKIYHCHKCHINTIESVAGIEKYARKANEFIKLFIKALNDNTYSATGRRFKVSCTNIILHFDKYRRTLQEEDVSAIKNIGIDEVRFIPTAGNYQCVLFNHDTGKIIDILSDRYLPTVTARLLQFANIEKITQDFWDTYRRAGKSVFKNVKIITDKFHLARFSTWSYNRTRVKIQKDKKLRLARSWKLQTKARKDLSKLAKRKLDALLSQDQELLHAYKAKEFFLSIIRLNDANEYKVKINKWIDYVKKHNLIEFYAIITTLNNWHEEIINMFDSKLSNGAIERVNRTIKQAKSNAYGFTNLDRSTDLIKMRMAS